MLIKDDRFLDLSWFMKFRIAELTAEERIEFLSEQKELETGVYQLGDFNAPDVVDEEYYQFMPWTMESFRDGSYFGEYGVCDNYQQVLEKYPFLQADDNQYVLTVCVVKKSDQPESGGWRWHKWGEYVGTKTPLHEYLYDEDDSIQEVFCYHIYKRKEEFAV
jgi:hypothetical protein